MVNLNDVIITPLKKIESNRGSVLHCLKHTDQNFSKFGEAYFSFINYRSIKAWKMHKKMKLNITVPQGLIKFVFFDGENKFREEFLGINRYFRLTIPPLVWFGFCGLAKPNSILLNIADIIHDKDEIELKEISDINYDWYKNL